MERLFCLPVLVAFLVVWSQAAPLPQSYDLRKAKPICSPPIQNQGQCGSSSVFGAVDALSVAFCTHGSQAGLYLPTLSSAYIGQCTGGGGCGGSDSQKILRFLQANGTLLTSCQANTSSTCRTPHCGAAPSACCLHGVPRLFKAGAITPLKTDEDIQKAIFEFGAVFAGVDASSWQFYTGGVASCNGTKSIDHAVYLIGWGQTSDATPYWIAANSWGSTWGMNGYVLVHRGLQSCGISANSVALSPDVFKTCGMSCRAQVDCAGGGCTDCTLAEGALCV